jgi:predicted PurR-regulated permease PerM
MDTVVNNIGLGFTNSISGFVGGGGSIFTRISGSFGLILGFASLPLFVFYLLKDSDQIQNNIYSALPPAVAGHTRNIVNIIDKVLGRYLRAQVVTGIIVGVVTYFGLSILRIPYALPLAFFNGLFAIIPSFGPIIAAVIILVVVLTEATSKTIPVAILLVVVELAKDLFVVPKITADRLHLHASLVIALLVLGAYFWGVWGVVLLVPIVATLIEVFNYVRAMSRNELTGEQLNILKTGGGPDIKRRHQR